MFSTIKGYAIAIMGVATAVFAVIFTMRGNKVESLKEEVKRQNIKAKVAKKVTENKVDVAAFEAKVKADSEAVHKANVEEFNDKYPVGHKFYV